MGTEDSAQPGLFAVSGTASGIAIALEDENGTPVKPNVPMRPAALKAGHFFKFSGLYFRPGTRSGKRGDFECVTTFLLEYD
jgi:type 1 fimbria pilin